MRKQHYPCHRYVKILASTALLLTGTVGAASAQGYEGAWLVALDGFVASPLTPSQSRDFSPGLLGGASVFRTLHPAIQLGVRLRAGGFFDGRAPANTTLKDPSGSWLVVPEAAVRFRPYFDDSAPRRSEGFFAEAAVGYGISGGDGAPAIEAALGWGFGLGNLTISPAVRYLQLIDTTRVVEDRDPRLFLAGVELTLFDKERVFAPIAAVTFPDSDGDGLTDDKDQCIDKPEDVDDFEDDDGCPDEDNDGDGLADVEDYCPNKPEDMDAWDDADGCPDPDNDGDGFADVDDACPEESEVINGVDDNDGCPDEGLIAMVHDRILFEESVLFDTGEDHLNERAHDVLVAAVELFKQHPEWLELRVEGHADVRGTDQFNIDLSQRRAEAVMAELIADGLPAHMLTAKGFGKSRPLDSRDTDEAHKRNRRVEIVLVHRREAKDTDHPDNVIFHHPETGKKVEKEQSDASEAGPKESGATSDAKEPATGPVSGLQGVN